MNKIIFLVSQPRAGSTMVQAVMSNHDMVSTASEPWLLLHLLYNRGSFTNSFASYTDTDCRKVYSDFMNKFEVDTGEKIVRKFVEDCYSELSGSSMYFLDKTPRYYLILDDIRKLFPDSKIIILKRNPLDVLRSIKNSFWPNAKTHLPLAKYHYHDIAKAPLLLHEFLAKHADDPNVISVKYEDLLASMGSGFNRLFSWLGLPYEKGVLNYAGNDSYHGMYGDQIRVRNEASIKIHKTNDFAYSRKWLRFEQGYLHDLGGDFLKEYGYSPNALITPKKTLMYENFKDMGIMHCDVIHGYKRSLLDHAVFNIKYLLS